jgi:hypothetical protein
VQQATVELFRQVTGNDFVDKTDEEIQGFLDIAETVTSTKVCLDVRHLLVVYDAAHRMTLAFRGGGVGGPITSQSEGQLSIGFGMVTGADPLLSTTSYGQLLEDLRRGCILGPRVCP